MWLWRFRSKQQYNRSDGIDNEANVTRRNIDAAHWDLNDNIERTLCDGDLRRHLD